MKRSACTATKRNACTATKRNACPATKRRGAPVPPLRGTPVPPAAPLRGADASDEELAALAKGLVNWLRPILADIEKRNAELEARLIQLEQAPTMKYCGVWEPERTYFIGDFVTDDGSLWQPGCARLRRHGCLRSSAAGTQSDDDGRDECCCLCAATPGTAAIDVCRGSPS
jgi:hypothetical protein